MSVDLKMVARSLATSKPKNASGLHQTITSYLYKPKTDEVSQVSQQSPVNLHGWSDQKELSQQCDMCDVMQDMSKSTLPLSSDSPDSDL